MVPLFVVLSLLLAACTGAEAADNKSESRPTGDPLIRNNAAPKPLALSDPESYGLPPLATLQANPTGVARGLVSRFSQTTWTMLWAVRSTNGVTPLAEMRVEHLPPNSDSSRQEKLRVYASIGTGDTGTAELAVLDEGNGARWCAQEGSSQWACDIGAKDLDLFFDFLSLDGFEELTTLLTETTALPGLSVQYAKIADTPAACFFFAPVPGAIAGPINVGVDLSKGGSFCLSTEGAVVRLVTGDLEISAIKYSTSVDPGRFRLPIEQS